MSLTVPAIRVGRPEASRPTIRMRARTHLHVPAAERRRYSSSSDSTVPARIPAATAFTWSASSGWMSSRKLALTGGSDPGGQPAISQYRGLRYTTPRRTSMSTKPSLLPSSTATSRASLWCSSSSSRFCSVTSWTMP